MAEMTRQRAIGLAYIALALLGILFALYAWWAGRLNMTNLLVFALLVAGCGPVGLLALQGDYPGRSLDEGQRQMYREAQSDAFHVAYFGLFAVFYALILFPVGQVTAEIAIGGLLLLVTLTWLGGYMWRRWRP